MRGRLHPTVHQAGLGEFELVLEPQAASAVEQPERAAGRGRRGDGSVQKLAVELSGLDVRFRQIGNLGHQLADLVLRLFEQTSIDGFFRHGGTSSFSAEAVVPAPQQAHVPFGDDCDAIRPARRVPLLMTDDARCRLT